MRCGTVVAGQIGLWSTQLYQIPNEWYARALTAVRDGLPNGGRALVFSDAQPAEKLGELLALPATTYNPSKSAITDLLLMSMASV